MADIFGLGSIAGSAISGAYGIGIAKLNNEAAKEREDIARKENYRFNEMSANAADARQRALINDYYTPSAQLEQLKAAGLSPSTMYGGEGSVGQTNAAQGAGAAGISPSVFGIDPMTMSQIDLNMAQAKKLNEESKNISTDTQIKEIQKDLQEMEKNLYNVDFKLVTTTVLNEDGTQTSLYDLAGNFNSYDEFAQKCAELGERTGDGEMGTLVKTEQGQKTLRSIYLSRHELNTEIEKLATDKLSAEFQREIVDTLKKTNYADLNAKAALAYLKSNIETNSLTEEQKGAWNRILDKLGEKGSTHRDIAIVLGMLIDRAATSWVNTNFNTGGTNSTVTHTHTKK